MATSESYDVVAANKQCSNQINKPTIITTPGTSTHTNQMQVNANENQHIEDSKYDNTDEITVKPLYGGNKKNKINKYYKINFNNKNKKYIASSYSEAIQKFLNKNKIQDDYLLEITEYYKNSNKTNLYLINKTK
jgi:type II secretory pathway component HofQ